MHTISVVAELLVHYRGQPNFGFGAEIGKNFSFGLVLFLVGRSVASCSYGQNCQRVSALTETGFILHLSVLQRCILLPSLHSVQSFAPVSCCSATRRVGSTLIHRHLTSSCTAATSAWVASPQGGGTVAEFRL